MLSLLHPRHISTQEVWKNIPKLEAATSRKAQIYIYLQLTCFSYIKLLLLGAWPL